MELKIGSEKAIIEYIIGVKQGDVLAPTLFLFLMQAMVERVLLHWKKENIQPFTYLSDSTNGKLVRHPTKPKHARVQLLQPDNVFSLVMLLYVDDAALCFTSYEEMTKGVIIVEHEMRRLGLVMHTGTLTKESKTKYLFIPGIYRTKQIIDEHVKKRALPMTTTCVTVQNAEETKKVRKHQLTEEEKHKIFITEYDHLPETRPFQTALGGTITATKGFTYLGSLVHFSLREKYNMDKRIQKAGKIMGALGFFW